MCLVCELCDSYLVATKSLQADDRVYIQPRQRSLLVQVKIMGCPNNTAKRRSVTLFCDLTVV